MRSWWRGRGFGARLFAMVGIVCVIGAGTAWAVAALVGPKIFHTHLTEAGLGAHDLATMHAEEAFESASVLALGGAMAVALVASLAASAWLARRVSRSLGTFTAAARALGSGEGAPAVDAGGLGPEFHELAATFESMRDRLAESEALRQRLLADVAHELRTPVANIEAMLEAVVDGVMTPDAVVLARLRDQSGRLTRLADDLASVSRVEAGLVAMAPVATSPAALVERAIAAAALRAEGAGVALVTELAAHLPSIVVDPLRISQVLDNLVANALAHTASGDTITVACHAVDDGVEFVVTDTGSGVAAEHLPYLFERFYRAESSRDRGSGGSGIGLAICKAIVEAHGGAIAVASDGPGTGTRVSFRLPREGELP